jgi:hypothetical protein
MSSLTTTDHDTIRRWAEERGGKPSEVISTAREGEVGIIRIDFPGFGGEGKLREIPWDDWFRKFDETSLAFVYEEQTADGQRSSFNKLVGRETGDARAKAEKTNRRAVRDRKQAVEPPTTMEPPGGRAAGSPPARKASHASGGRRQAARAEVARTARPRRPSRSAAGSRGTGRGKKTGTAGRSARGTAGGARRSGARGGRKNK